MAILTQGTQVFFIDPADDSVVKVAGCTAFNPGGNPADQIETTPLEVFDREYLPGLRTPGQAQLTLNADPSLDSHVRLHELTESNPPPTLKWAIGWSDGDAPPTVDVDGEWVLPATRTWFSFSGYPSDFPFDFAGNTIVTSTVQITRSGGGQWKRKA